MRRILEGVAAGDLSVERAVAALEVQSRGYVTTDSARVDLQRKSRRGLPEVVYCEAKSPEQVRSIFMVFAENGETALGTRANEAHFQAVREALSEVTYDPIGRLLIWQPSGETSASDSSGKRRTGYITVVSAGSADEPVLREAVGTLELFGHTVKVVRDAGVAGLQRILDHVELMRDSLVVIVVAGMDGALPSVVSGLIPTPVIAVPTSVGYGASFGGVSALLAMLNNCSSGVSVVNIDNGFGAAYAAALIAGKVEQDV